MGSHGKGFKINRSGQLGLFGAEPELDAGKPRSQGPIVFVSDDPREIRFGNRLLGEYLIEAGLDWVIELRLFLQSLDWSALESVYKVRGRAPYRPASMMSLVFYGITKGLSSLRELEALARTDLGAMWVCGGIAPDHASIGRFLNRHAEQISGEFFEQLTSEVLKSTKGGIKDLAGDGTIVMAACSRYNMISEEAAIAQARDASAKAAADKENRELQQRAEKARAAADIATARADKKRSKGKGDSANVSPVEPESCIQQQKDKSIAPSYKPSVLANKERVIVALAVHPSSENEVLDRMLGQAERVGDEANRRLMLDAGYFANSVIDTCLQKDIDLLCPEGRRGNSTKQSRKKTETGKGHFPKSLFVYNEETDSYLCPAGQTLTHIDSYKGNNKAPAYRRYATTHCKQCPQLGQCTSSKDGRKVKRYAGDEAKDALRKVMTHPQARSLYARRQAWVEPVFADVKERQGLRRFRRRGLKQVILEFALHASTHNLRRLLALLRRGSALRAAFFALVRALAAPELRWGRIFESEA